MWLSVALLTACGGSEAPVAPEPPAARVAPAASAPGGSGPAARTAPAPVPVATPVGPVGVSLPGGLHAGPNVLLITIDTLRADHLGAYGYTRPTSPAIDRLANGGVRFSRAYSARGATWPSLTTLMTSLYPVEHGVRDNSTQVSDAPTTLAEVLRGRGYTTSAWMTNAEDAHWEGISNLQPIRDEPLDALAAERVARHLGKAIESPWFIWVHLTAPHDPYVDHPEVGSFLDRRYRGPISDDQGSLVRSMFAPPSAADHAAILARYDSEVAFSDAAVDRILTALRVGHLADSTLVVLSADHGDELADHPPYLFHFASLWDGVLHVPLVASQPGRLPAGRVVDGAVGLIDLAPTVLDWLGLEPPAAWHGRSLAPLVSAGGRGERPVISELRGDALAIHDGPWSYVWNPRRTEGVLAPPQQLREAGLEVSERANAWPIPASALFDVEKDPRQQVDVAGQNPEVVRRLTGVLEGFRAGSGWPGVMPSEAPPAVERQLQSLGYTSKGPR